MVWAMSVIPSLESRPLRTASAVPGVFRYLARCEMTKLQGLFGGRTIIPRSWVRTFTPRGANCYAHTFAAPIVLAHAVRDRAPPHAVSSPRRGRGRGGRARGARRSHRPALARCAQR